MNVFTIAAQYISWHYTRAFGEIFRVWRNIMWFMLHFFSLPVLLKTFFSPWKRLHEEYAPRFSPAQWAEAFILNTFMRLIGAIIRTVVICVAVAFIAASFFGGIVFYAFWLTAPLVIVILLLNGVTQLFGVSLI